MCENVLKCNDMFGSREDCRTSKKQSFMSLFRNAEAVKHSLINTHIPYTHFILVLFIATPLSRTFCKLVVTIYFATCVDLNQAGN